MKALFLLYLAAALMAPVAAQAAAKVQTAMGVTQSLQVLAANYRPEEGAPPAGFNPEASIRPANKHHARLMR